MSSDAQEDAVDIAREQAVQTMSPESLVDDTDTSVSTVVSEKKKSKKGILIIIIALTIVAVISVAIWYWYSNKNAMDIQDAANSVLYLEMYDHHDNIIGTASGFIINDGETLVTNYHVIEHAYRILAQTPNGERAVEVNSVISYDNTADLAVLKCDQNSGVAPLILGDSESVRKGDSVYAVGYPLGIVNTLSDGVVSSRYFDENDVDTIQITAPISSGSSGGPLFNKKGEVVGVIAAYYVDGQNLNIAIAANTLSPLLQSTSITPLADIYSPPPLDIGMNEDEYLQVSIEDLYHYPSLYDGLNVEVEAWMSYYVHQTPTYSEYFYEIYLVNDKSAFVNDKSAFWGPNTALLLEKAPSLFAIGYESNWLENVPHVVGRIYDSNIQEELRKREIRVTCYGQFTYNPMEERFITDPSLYNLDVVAYELGR